MLKCTISYYIGPQKSVKHLKYILLWKQIHKSQTMNECGSDFMYYFDQ